MKTNKELKNLIKKSLFEDDRDLTHVEFKVIKNSNDCLELEADYFYPEGSGITSKIDLIIIDKETEEIDII